MQLKKIIERYIGDKNLCNRNDKLLVALSGGADSVALLCVLLSLGYDCEGAHCNFHLRGEESDRDELFVRNLCQKRNVPLHVIHFETTAYAHEHHLSIEMAARQLRYEWFEQLRMHIGAQYIAVAHHRDDNVETFLLNLMRGTGIDGLKGIQPRNGVIIRPLLAVGREDITNYLNAIGQTYVTDSTNLQDEYTRNKIRLNILPLMREINPSVGETIAETMNRLSEVAAVYHEDRLHTLNYLLKEIPDGRKYIPINNILNDIAPASLLHEVLYPLGFNASQTQDILRSLKEGQSGKRFRSKEWETLRDRDRLWIYPLFVGDEKPCLQMEIHEITPGFLPSMEAHIATLDADKVNLPLEIRKWQEGDTFIPFGMKGKKNVCKYMTDRKFSLYQKERQYVACSEGKIVWLIGERIDNRFRVTEETKRVLVLRIEG